LFAPVCFSQIIKLQKSFVLFYLQTKLEFGQNIIVFGRYLSSITVESEHTRIPDKVETYNIHAIR